MIDDLTIEIQEMTEESENESKGKVRTKQDEEAETLGEWR